MSDFNFNHNASRFSFFGREDEYRRWAGDVKERASRPCSISWDEAPTFMGDTRSLWILQVVYSYYLTIRAETDGMNDTALRRSISAPFVTMALNLFHTALAVQFDEMSLLSDIIDSVGLHLSTLRVFSDLYRQHRSGDSFYTSDHLWPEDLRGKIRELEQQAREEEVSKLSHTIRSASNTAKTISDSKH